MYKKKKIATRLKKKEAILEREREFKVGEDIQALIFLYFLRDKVKVVL